LFLKDPLEFPSDTSISKHAKSVLEQLLCSSDNRLGKNGVDDFQKQPFFGSIDWNNLRRSSTDSLQTNKQTKKSFFRVFLAKAPYIPKVQGPTDTSNFSDFDPNAPDNVGHFYLFTRRLLSVVLLLETY